MTTKELIQNKTMVLTMRKDFHDRIVKLARAKGISNQAQLRIMLSDILKK